jgi:hypothetical protein
MVMKNKAPDTSGANAAALQNAQLAREQLDFTKQVYAEQRPMLERAEKTAQEVSAQQLASMRQNDSISKDYYNYQTTTFRPMEKQMVADAQNYDTAERRDAQAARAVADVGMQAEAARQSQVRGMQRMGINPNSGKMMNMQSTLGLQEAAAKAGAANKARDAIETQGWARRMDAASLGRNLASNQATSAGVALNAGNSAVGNAGVPLQQSNASAGLMQQGFSGAVIANNSAGQLNIGAANASKQDNSAVWGSLGSVAGAVLPKMLSDKNAKKNIKPMSDEKALQAVKDTPVSEWTYKDGKGDGGAHIGPMAQHVKKTMGENVAPGGKQIDLISMNGMNMAATAALARKVDKLADKVEGAKQ